ncbi:MAG: hypothetical protein INF11_13915 [Methylobacterium sp.]|nr:hypothetical protein [Methylobacterium sp.]MCA3673013.1 hypothetical protein [Methylobacterium sp.]
MGNLIALAIAVGPAISMFFRWTTSDEAVRQEMIRIGRHDLLETVPDAAEKKRRAVIYALLLIGGTLVGSLFWRS